MDTDTTPHPLTIRVGANIRRHRLARKLSVEQAAAATGIVSAIGWRKYEAGERWPRPGHWQAVADALRVSPATLLLAEKTPEKSIRAVLQRPIRSVSCKTSRPRRNEHERVTR